MSGVADGDGDVGQDGRLNVLPAGTTLRGYELKSILGQGAFGITYRARDLTLGRDVAIKEYLPTNLAARKGRTTVLPLSPDHAEQFAWGRERFLDEARTLARLDRTPAIVRVHDFLEDNGTAYMVMALVEGENLNKRLLREGRLAPEAVERLLFPLLDGLEEVHGIGFLHRDIKPANIMVDARGRPTLIDFGAARAAMAGRSTTMTAIFTPGYAAVEQYTSAKLGPWTDIYGISATLYHAITGKIPPSSIDRMVEDKCEPLTELKPDGFAPELLVGIDAGMVLQVTQRPQSIPEWRRVLRTGERAPSSQEVTQVEVKRRRLGRRSGIKVPGPVLWGTAVAGILALAAGGYLAFTANQPITTATASLNMTTEQLEQVLAERRRADAFAADKRRLEEEARRKAETDAEAKRQADAELEQTRQARQKAEQELAELKARIETQRQADSGQRDQEAVAAQRAADEAAQRRAEADAAALRQAEEEAKRKAEAEAETKRQTEEALAKVEAERQRAEQEAKQKAETEQAALRRASEDAQRKAAEAESVKQAERERVKAEADRARAEEERQKAEAEAKARAEAETAEKALHLEQADRQRLQVALTSLGFDTRGNDGIFGPRTREMIAGWQKKAGAPATGFLTAVQPDQISRAAASAVARWDEEQKKAEDEKKKSEATQTATASSPSGSGASAPPVSGSSGPGVASAGSSKAAVLPDGTYRGGLGIYSRALSLEVRMSNGSSTGTVTSSTCGTAPMSLTVDASGNVTGQTKVIFNERAARGCDWTPARITGRVDGSKLLLVIEGDLLPSVNTGTKRGEATLTLGGAAAAATGPAALPSPDGLWRGSLKCQAPTGVIYSTPEFAFPLDIQLVGGKGTWKSPTASPNNGNTLEIRVSVEGNRVQLSRYEARLIPGTSGVGGLSVPSTISGTYDGDTIAATGREGSVGYRECTLTLRRA
jgi:peptidoglycan hydrolase-like protein with peptidoglycan-binding domain